MSHQGVSTLALLASLVLYGSVVWVGMRITLRLLPERAPAPRNFRGRPTPVGLGLVWLWVAAGMPLVWVVRSVVEDIFVRSTGTAPYSLNGMGPWEMQGTLLLVVGGVLGSGLIPMVFGLIDDFLGTEDVRGLRGHIAAARSGRVTTGAVKLLGIGGYALLVTATSGLINADVVFEGVMWTLPRIGLTLAAAALIAGSANLLNLLDTRPGRALKGYALLVLVAGLALALSGLDPLVIGTETATQRTTAIATVVAFVLVPVLVVWRADLGEKAMLGDAGANAFGFVAGYLLAIVLPWPGVVTAALIVVALNLVSERVSFSAVIERTPLKWVDAIGRQ